jgi:hypothetical protein
MKITRRVWLATALAALLVERRNPLREHPQTNSTEPVEEAEPRDEIPGAEPPPTYDETSTEGVSGAEPPPTSQEMPDTGRGIVVEGPL